MKTGYFKQIIDVQKNAFISISLYPSNNEFVKYEYKSLAPNWKLHENLKSQRNIDLVMDNIRPKIFWKDKPVFLKQLKNWNIEKLEEAKKIIVETEIKMKTKLNNYNILLMKNLLIRLFQIAKSTS